MEWKHTSDLVKLFPHVVTTSKSTFKVSGNCVSLRKNILIKSNQSVSGLGCTMLRLFF